MATLTVQPAETQALDCYLRNTLPTSPMDGAVLNAGTLFVLGSSIYQRMLARFSLADLGATAVVTSAIVTFTITGGSTPVGATYTANRVTRTGWTENASWNLYDGSSSWTAAGGDYTASNASTVVYSSGSTLVFNVASMLADARTSGLLYLDLIVRGPEVDGSSNYVVCDSSASATEANRPKLVVTFTTPASGLEFTLPDDVPHFTLPDDRFHFVLPEE